LHRRVIEGDVLYAVYANTFSDVSYEECESESVNSDVATASAGKQSGSFSSVFTSDSDVQMRMKAVN
jgi:hypothetical protein